MEAERRSKCALANSIAPLAVFPVFDSTALLEVFTFVILLSHLSIGGLSFNICLSNWVLEVLVFDNETV